MRSQKVLTKMLNRMRNTCPQLRLKLRLLTFCMLLLPALSWSDAVSVRHGISMYGDLKYPPHFSHFQYANPQAPKAGKIRLAALGTNYDTLNPFTLKGTAAAGLDNMYDSLTVSSQDEANTGYGLIAETIEIPADRSWVIFNLRPEARWHDGTPITAEDVAFSFKVFTEQAHPFYRSYYSAVEAVEVLNPQRIKFTFSGSNNRELPIIMGQLTVLPKHYWQDRDFEKTTLDPPLGSGPYRIKSFESGRYIVYERVADYWGKDLPVNKGRHNFDEIRYDYYRDGTVATEAFKAGAYDFRSENISKNWASAYDEDKVDAGLLVKETLAHQNPRGMQGFIYNIRKDLFQDSKVRQALAYAFDFEWANHAFFHDQYTRTNSYFANSELAAKGLPSEPEREVLAPFRDQLPEAVFTQLYQAPKTDGSGHIRDNLRKGVELLQQAGWRWGDLSDPERRGKMVNDNNQPFEFELLLNYSPAWERIALAFKKNLARMGITLNIRAVDSAQYQKRAESFDFDMMVMVIPQSLSPGNEQLNFWGSEAADQPGSRNLIGIKSPVVDQLIDLIISAPDRQSLVARTRALDRVLLWGHYVIPHWHISHHRLIYWNKLSRPEITPKYALGFDTWWYDAEKAAVLQRKRNREDQH